MLQAGEGNQGDVEGLGIIGTGDFLQVAGAASAIDHVVAVADAVIGGVVVVAAAESVVTGAGAERIVAAAAVEDDAVAAGEAAGIDFVGIGTYAAVDGDGGGRKTGAPKIAGDHHHVGAGAGVDKDVFDLAGRDFEIGVGCWRRDADAVLYIDRRHNCRRSKVMRLMLNVSEAARPWFLRGHRRRRQAPRPGPRRHYR